MIGEKLPPPGQDSAEGAPPSFEVDPFKNPNITEALGMLDRLQAVELLTRAGDRYFAEGYELKMHYFTTNVSVVCGLSLEGMDRVRDREAALMIGLRGARERYEQNRPCWTTLGVVHLPDLHSRAREVSVAEILGTEHFTLYTGTQLTHRITGGYIAKQLSEFRFALDILPHFYGSRREKDMEENALVREDVMDMVGLLPISYYGRLSRAQASAKLESIVQEKMGKEQFDRTLQQIASQPAAQPEVKPIPAGNIELEVEASVKRFVGAVGASQVLSAKFKGKRKQTDRHYLTLVKQADGKTRYVQSWHAVMKNGEKYGHEFC